MKFYYKMRKKRPDLNAMGILKEERVGRPFFLGQLASIQRVEHFTWNTVYSQLREDLW